MGEKDKFELLNSEKIDKEIYKYLKEFFNGLLIEILGDYQGNIMNLMYSGKLEGWCWQTTSTAALFMPDDVLVVRGDLELGKYNHYYHGFILFDYKENKYVFDPCLNLINSAELFFKTFKVDIKGYVTAKEVKEFFINYINNPPKKKEYVSQEAIDIANRIMKKMFGEDYLENRKKEVVINDKENPNAPMYRNNSGYKDINIENNKIKSLTVHYYLNA